MNGSLLLTPAPVLGQTRPTRMMAVPPLQCSRVRYDDPQHPAMACLTLLHLGGVLQGDQLALDVTLEPRATTRLTTAAATQIYRMPEREAAQTTTITLHHGSHLTCTPEPTILFAGSRFSQSTRVTLHEDAQLVLRELLVCGRLARGEQHQYERYRSQFEVCDASGRCLLSERSLLEPALHLPATIGVQAAYPVVGSLYLLALNADTTSLLECAWNALNHHRNVVAGAGALPNKCGVLVRALGETSAAVRAALDAVRCCFKEL